MIDLPGESERTGARKGGSRTVDKDGNEITEKKDKPVKEPSRKRSTRQGETEEDEGGEG